MVFRKFAGGMRPDWVVYTAYIDVVFAASTIVDMMALTILNRVLLYRTIKRCTLTRAIIGSIWSCVVSLAPGTPVAVEILGAYVAVNSLMVVAAYHLKSPKEAVKSVAGIYLVSVVLGGVMLALCEHIGAGYYAWFLVEVGRGGRIPAIVWFLMIAGAAAACYGFSGGIKELIHTMAHGKDLCRVTMIYDEKEETVTGLIDMGNQLREPVSNQPVHVAAAGLMKQLCPTVKGVVYVPYQPVEITGGVLPAVLIDRVETEQGSDKYSLEKPLIAITKQELSPSGEYQILIQKSD